MPTSANHNLSKIDFNTMVEIRSLRMLSINTDLIYHSFGHDMRAVGQWLIGIAGFPHLPDYACLAVGLFSDTLAVGT